jgi:hypothetical protein
MSELNDLANNARVLQSFAPEAAKRLCDTISHLERLRKCYVSEDDPNAANIRRWIEDHQRDYNCWSNQCGQAWQRFHQLAVDVYKLLPEMITAKPLDYVRIGPEWRMDDPATDWDAIKAELKRIEDAALAKLMAAESGNNGNDNSAIELSDLMTELTRQQSRIVEYLWTRRKASYEDLIDSVWGGDAEEEALGRAIKRANQRLFDLTQGKVTLTTKNRFVTLEK